MCRQALEPDASVKEVAWRHGEHASQLHRWLNDHRCRPASHAAQGFLSVDVSPEGDADGPGITGSSRAGGLNETSVRRLLLLCSVAGSLRCLGLSASVILQFLRRNSSNTRVWLAAGVTDMRRGFNTLAA